MSLTLTEYAGAVTAIMDDAGWQDYPASFDSDVEACWHQRLTPEDAAAVLRVSYEEAEDRSC